jgi:hypothetical protein
MKEINAAYNTIMKGGQDNDSAYGDDRTEYGPAGGGFEDYGPFGGFGGFGDSVRLADSAAIMRAPIRMNQRIPRGSQLHQCAPLQRSAQRIVQC